MCFRFRFGCLPICCNFVTLFPLIRCDLMVQYLTTLSTKASQPLLLIATHLQIPCGSEILSTNPSSSHDAPLQPQNRHTPAGVSLFEIRPLLCPVSPCSPTPPRHLALPSPSFPYSPLLLPWSLASLSPASTDVRWPDPAGVKDLLDVSLGLVFRLIVVNLSRRELS